MAKLAKIFSIASATSGAQAGQPYTVPPGKYAIVNVFGGTGNAGNGFTLNGVSFQIGDTMAATRFPGITLPAGSTISAVFVSGSPVLLTGFEYDA